MFIIFGKKHLDYLLSEFTNYYNEHRSHMEGTNLPPLGQIPDECDTVKLSDIEVKRYVGGLVASFERKAA